jgi:hypothetical protein
MNFMYALFFGAGTAAFVYSTLARRVGYGNNKSIVTMVGVVFVLTTIVFYTILAFIIHS